MDELAHVIFREIKPNTLPVTENAVGLDPRVTNITKLFRSDSEEGVIKIGLYGLGGVGKSTLAKALYNQLLLERTFKRSCFLGEVREASLRAGLVSLQEKLLNEVSVSKKIFKVGYVDEGIKFIKNRICSEKLLLLIDDIDNCDQYESLVGPFAPGSVVIITTRNKEILEKIGVETKYIHKVKELDDAESRLLFTQHAFKSTTTPADDSFEVLIDKILSLAGGLPLALKVFGAYLYTVSNQEAWISYIKDLEQNPDSYIKEKHVISLEALKLENRKLEKLFLDIACFFIGRKRKEVVDIPETYYPNVNPKIDTLKKRCLLDDDDSDDTLKMHELLRDIGRDVVRNKSDEEPEKYSRLWLTKDICRVLKNGKVYH